MGKIDKKKEEVAKYKFYLGMIVASIFGCVSWLVNNYEKELLLAIIDIILIIGLSFIAFKMDKAMKKAIDDLEEL